MGELGKMVHGRVGRGDGCAATLRRSKRGSWHARALTRMEAFEGVRARVEELAGAEEQL